MNSVEVEYGLDLTKFFSDMQKVSNTLGGVEDAIQKTRRIDPFAQQATSATKFNQQLGQQVIAYQKVQAVETSLFNERKRLETQLGKPKKTAA